MYKAHIYLFLLLMIAIKPLALQAANEPHTSALKSAGGDEIHEVKEQTKVLVLGDSLSAGYGIDIESGWVNLLEQELTKSHQIQIINASISGETSSGGNSRLAALLDEHKPQVVILELGGNDGLRGQPLKLLSKNLQAMIDASRAVDAKILLLGMQIPPNYGARYSNQFKQTYETLAQKNDLALVPFLLEGIAGNNNLMQRDGIHPTAEAQPLIVENVLPALEKLLD